MVLVLVVAAWLAGPVLVLWANRNSQLPADILACGTRIATTISISLSLMFVAVTGAAVAAADQPARTPGTPYDIIESPGRWWIAVALGCALCAVISWDASQSARRSLKCLGGLGNDEGGALPAAVPH